MREQVHTAVLPPELRADCASCRALCCVAPAFLAVQGFRFDKPAQTPCRLLRPDDRCTIHAELLERGFPACASYECHGAGQRATALFDGKSWRMSTETAMRMFDAFGRLRVLHELMAMIVIGIDAVADRASIERLRAQYGAIESICKGTAEQVEVADVASIRREAMTLLREATAGVRGSRERQ